MAKLAKVTTVILAGGLGCRLRSSVANRPKVLAGVKGRPFLAYLLDQALAWGIDRVVLCTGYLGEQVRDTFGEAYRGLKLAYSQESEPRGTAGCLRLALPMFDSNPVLVMNGDSFCQMDLAKFWDWHHKRGAAGTILLAKVIDTGQFGTVKVDSDGHVLCFEEKGEGQGPGWVNAGIYILSRKLLFTIPEQGSVSLERDIFPAWVGRSLYGYCSEARFLDIGTPESYSKAQRFLADFASLGVKPK